MLVTKAQARAALRELKTNGCETVVIDAMREIGATDDEIMGGDFDINADYLALAWIATIGGALDEK